jgi:hypothetical protein
LIAEAIAASGAVSGAALIAEAIQFSSKVDFAGITA